MGKEVEEKNWMFSSRRQPKLKFLRPFAIQKYKKKMELRSIIAKSDYLRMAVVNKLGGIWIDADTAVLKDFTPYFCQDNYHENKLVWHSEAFFGSTKGNRILAKAAKNYVGRGQCNVGAIQDGSKTYLQENTSQVIKMPYTMITPGYESKYNFVNNQLVFREDLEPD